MKAKLVQANALKIPLADGTVQTCVTSPPYFGLRDYGTAEWVGGDPECDHNPQRPDGGDRADRALPLGRGGMYKYICGKCNAKRVDEQIGLEGTLQEYIENICKVMDEVWRVLRDDGTLWLNLGDSYATGHTQGATDNEKGWKHGKISRGIQGRASGGDLPAKNLIGVPWRVALALQERGWYLRRDNIWAKKSWMPESVKGWRWEKRETGEMVLRKGAGRSTTSHEYIFQFSKSEAYYFDHFAVMEKARFDGRRDTVMKGSDKYKDGFSPVHKDQTVHHRGHERWPNTDNNGNKLRNRRSVWADISPSNYSGPHFAAFPPDLPQICILAGTSEKGQCPECGAPWARVVEKGFTDHTGNTQSGYQEGSAAHRLALLRQAAREEGQEYSNTWRTTGWRPTCSHEHEPVPQIVLDPFGGSGTTAMVAQKHNRIGICLDLSWEYLQLAKERCGIKQMKEFYDGKKVETNIDNLPLFQNLDQ